MHRNHLYFAIVFVVMLILASCKKEDALYEGAAKLRFSTDTVMFDTIFTGFGSTTQQLKVYNPYDQKLKITSIDLAKGNNSSYRLNINGYQANSIKDVELPAGDSLFIFVEVTVEPGRSEMVEQDSILFHINGNTQDIDLVAFGQDVHLIIADTITQHTQWLNDKPYLVYYYLMVDSLINFRIDTGVQVHFHKNGIFIVKRGLQVNGNVDEPVVFQGDRLEDIYDDIPGQWDRIVFFEGSTNNYMKNAIVKNGFYGVQLGALNGGPPPGLLLENTVIQHMSYSGIYSLGGQVAAVNTVVADCGYYALALLIGGYYEFYQCTVVNQWYYSTRNTASVVLSNNLYAQETYYTGDLVKAEFRNCILSGSLENELNFSNDESTAFNYHFDHCIIKNKDVIDTNVTAGFGSILWNGDPDFVDYDESDYQLGEESEAIDAGDYSLIDSLPLLQLDLNGEMRDTFPDLGAYEKTE